MGTWITLLFAAATTSSTETTSEPWPSFRGARASGVAEGAKPPTEWDYDERTNIQWERYIPGLAHSSPVVWGDTIFVTTALREDGNEEELKIGLYGSIEPVPDEGEQSFQVMAIDRNDGEILWEETAWVGSPRFPRHPKGSFAASSPATNGDYVVAFFGTEGLYCFDSEGELAWEKDLGELSSCFYMVPSAEWGFSSSPVIHEDKVIVQCDIQKGSFLAALDLKTGKELWRTAREEVPTWSTPTVDIRDGRRQIIVNGYKHIGAYELDTGKEIWKLVGGGDIPVPAPVVAHDLVFITNAHGQMAPIYAIDTMAEGELTIDADTCEGMVWSYPTRGNYMQTPLVYGDHLYMCTDAGVLTCYVARTGEEKYRQRLGRGQSGFTASSVAANGHLYFTSEDGETYVVKAGPKYEEVAVNDNGEPTMATPAIAGNSLIIRTRSFLMSVGEGP